MSQNEKNEKIKGKNDILDEIIDKSKIVKKIEDLKGFWRYKDFGDKK